MMIKRFMKVMMLAQISASTALAADPAISVSIRQRYPWNGLVDLNFTITGTSGTQYATSFTAKDMVGNTNIAMRTIRKSDGTAATATEQLLPGTYNWVWDAVADLPKDFKCDRVTVTGTAVEPVHLYMVIDLSGGANASSYPVSYLDAVPSGGWSDEYKTTMLVLRRIESSEFNMGSPETEIGREENETLHKVTITTPYYVSIYPVTRNQYYQVIGNGILDQNPIRCDWGLVRGWDTDASSSGALKLKSLPGETGSPKRYDFTVTQVKSATNYGWPDKTGVDASSFMGKLRTKTGLQFDLPTEAQWEMACKGGSDISVVEANVPNMFGIYEMASTNGEWCLDVYSSDLGTESVVDPVGLALSANITKTVIASGIKIWSIGSDVNWDYIECIYNGKTYSDDYYYSWYEVPIYLTCNAYGCKRVVRGMTNRAAARTFANSINSNLAIVSNGVVCRRKLSGSYYNKKTYKVKWTNPVHAFRLCLPLSD